MGTKLSIQYLEPRPGVGEISPMAARARLREAFDRLPLNWVIVGWDLPSALVEACAEETSRTGAQFFRWMPLLTCTGRLLPRAEWRTVGLNGEVVPAFSNMLEFTFVCPNRPAVRNFVLDHVREVLHSGPYQGIFFDLIRFPSPSVDPSRDLACFCPDCRNAAAQIGLDLVEVALALRSLLASPDGALGVVEALLSPEAALPHSAELIQAFLAFRMQSITSLVQAACNEVCSAGAAVGLDCFAPALTRMVGQDLGMLAGLGWIKVMTYAHTFYGPAGMPYELLGLIEWLLQRHLLSEKRILEVIERATSLPLGSSLANLRQQGLPPQALAVEVRRGRDMGVQTMLAGVELVQMEGVTRLSLQQIRADLDALKEAGADGLALSWDLWHIPPEYLDLVRQVWLG